MDHVMLRSWLRRSRAQPVACARFAAIALTVALFAAAGAPAVAATPDAPTTAAETAGTPALSPGSAATPSADRSHALQRALAAVVGIETVAIEDAGSVATLGQEREGSGVVIGADGLVLTI